MQKPHEAIMQLADAFDMADRNVKPDAKTQRSNYQMGAKGLPRTPAQMASVKKAAAKSAAARRVPTTAAAQTPGVTTGGLGLASRPKSGLLK